MHRQIIQVIMTELTEKQKATRMLIAEHLQFLMSQEDLVTRLVDSRWAELSPQIEMMIDQKIQERLAHAGTTINQ